MRSFRSTRLPAIGNRVVAWGFCSRYSKGTRFQRCFADIKRATRGPPVTRVIRENPCQSVAAGLDVQVLHIQSVLFDELAPCFNVLAHQRGEDRLALCYGLELHRE